MLQHDMA
jgi:hypothetical protein